MTVELVESITTVLQCAGRPLSVLEITLAVFDGSWHPGIDNEKLAVAEAILGVNSPFVLSPDVGTPKWFVRDVCNHPQCQMDRAHRL